MKIEGTCNTCGRRFLLSQIGPESDAPGRCPFCGAHFARHYSTLLPDVVKDAELTASRFVHAIDRLLGMETGFDIQIDEMLAEIAEQLRAQEAQGSAT